MAVVINVADNMAVGRVHFSLKLMQVVEVKLEIDKPASEELVFGRVGNAHQPVRKSIVGGAHYDLFG